MATLSHRLYDRVARANSPYFDAINEEIELIIQFANPIHICYFIEIKHGLLYSALGVCLRAPDQNTPLPLVVLTRKKLRQWYNGISYSSITSVFGRSTLLRATPEWIYRFDFEDGYSQIALPAFVERLFDSP